MKHFGLFLKDSKYGFRLTLENFIQPNCNEVVDDELKNKLIANYTNNINYFDSLSKDDFNHCLNSFFSKYKNFKEIFDLSQFRDVSGYYILVLDNYKQIYFGVAYDIAKRVKEHWITKKSIKYLILGDEKVSKFPIDSFRALDTARIFICQNDYLGDEEKYIKKIDKNFLLNRARGGEGVKGLKSGSDAHRLCAYMTNLNLPFHDKDNLYNKQGGKCMQCHKTNSRVSFCTKNNEIFLLCDKCKFKFTQQI